MRKNILFFMLLLISCSISNSEENNPDIFIKNNKTGKIIKGDINKDNKKDYVIEYSNIPYKEDGYDKETVEKLYEEGKNEKCLKFFVSEGKGYRSFNSCKLVVPFVNDDDVEYKIQNSKISISKRNMTKLSGFSDDFIEIKYEKNQLIVDNIYRVEYSKKADKKTGEDDYTVIKSPKVNIRKVINDFDVTNEF